MLDSIDFFFSPYPTAQQRRLRAAHEDGLAHGSRMVSGRPEGDKAVTLLLVSSVTFVIQEAVEAAELVLIGQVLPFH